MQKCRLSVGAEWEYSAEIRRAANHAPMRVSAERQTERMEFLPGSVELTTIIYSVPRGVRMNGKHAAAAIAIPPSTIRESLTIIAATTPPSTPDNASAPTCSA